MLPRCLLCAVEHSGTFNWTTGASECSPCPAGYSCGIRTSNYSQHRCPLGHYCPASSDSTAPPQCPAGTLASEKGLKSQYQCQPCPLSKVCSDPGLANTATPPSCPVGSYCPPGDQVSLSATVVKPCPAGSYCPEGTVVPIKCPAGTLLTPLLSLLPAPPPSHIPQRSLDSKGRKEEGKVIQHEHS